MNQQHEMPMELTDAELAQIQGGSFFGDVWRAVKKGAGIVVKVGQVIIDHLVKHPPRTDSPPPWGSY